MRAKRRGNKSSFSRIYENRIVSISVMVLVYLKIVQKI